MTNSSGDLVKEAVNTMQSLQELSRLLGTDLDVEALSICVRLCEAGVNPEVLAGIVSELQKDVKSVEMAKNLRNAEPQNK